MTRHRRGQGGQTQRGRRGWGQQGRGRLARPRVCLRELLRLAARHLYHGERHRGLGTALLLEELDERLGDVLLDAGLTHAVVPAPSPGPHEAPEPASSAAIQTSLGPLVSVEIEDSRDDLEDLRLLGSVGLKSPASCGR